VHAIPAITFGYLLVPAVAILLWQNKAHLRWVMANGVVLLVLTLLLLLPFIIHFKNDNSPQLLAMIRDWQNGQMDKKLSGNLLRNLSVVFDKNVFFLGDILPAVTAASIALLLVFRQWRPVLLVSLFVLYIFGLMLNSAYWLLPVSELLYPERVAYFMIVACSFFLGYLLTVLGQKGYGITVMKKKATAFGFVAMVLVLLGLVKLYNGSVQLINNKTLNCNAQTMQAMDWISSHTEKDALIVVNYADAGMWVPTFTNRAALGTHIHFIHEVKHINDTLEASTAPRYIFITQNDRREHKWILGKIGNRAKVFGNSEVEVYH
jgi:hypothetical protein